MEAIIIIVIIIITITIIMIIIVMIYWGFIGLTFEDFAR